MVAWNVNYEDGIYDHLLKLKKWTKIIYIEISFSREINIFSVYEKVENIMQRLWQAKFIQYEKLYMKGILSLIYVK